MLRLLALAVALLSPLWLSAHRMSLAPSAMTMSTATLTHEGHGAPSGSMERGACQVHCLAAAAPAAVAAIAPATLSSGAFGTDAPAFLDGLSPPPMAPPPKLPAST